MARTSPDARSRMSVFAALAVLPLVGGSLFLTSPAHALTPGAPRTVSFAVADVTAGFTTWTVPAGVTQLRITAVGGNGGDSLNSAPGGRGAIVVVDAAVTPGEVLTVAVGSAGGRGTNPGVPGGGRNVHNNVPGSGGGFSGVLHSDGTPVVVAGAGGGAGIFTAPHGGDAGMRGGDDLDGIGGEPGTDTAGGAGGTAEPGGVPGPPALPIRVATVAEVAAAAGVAATSAVVVAASTTRAVVAVAGRASPSPVRPT